MPDPNVNSVARLPTGKAVPGLKTSLGQVLAQGRDVPTGLYPITTRNDWEHQVGYDNPNAPLWDVTGRLTLNQNTGITDSKTLTATNTADKFVYGDIGLPDESGDPTRVGKYDWAIDARTAGLRMSRPTSDRAPFVRSGLNPAMRKDALDYNVRGNLPENEWFGNSFPRVFEQGNGYALAGPAWVTSVGAAGINVDVF